MTRFSSLLLAIIFSALSACGGSEPEPENTVSDEAQTAARSAAAMEEGGETGEGEAGGTAMSTASASASATDDGGYASAPSGRYTLDKAHGYIVFTYVHQGYSTPFLRWRDWDATLDWDAANPEASSVSVVINAAEVDSGVDEFDGHLRGETFFDTDNYPQITFNSTAVNMTSDTTGTITGDLTIKDETHPVTLNVTFNKAGYSDRSNMHKLGFSATAEVNRSTWGVDRAVPNVSDEVNLIIEAEFMMPGDAE